jgi:PAS domain S-box-containing protein
VRVLIAESRGERLAWLQRCVEDRGHDVTAVADGHAAWEAWEAGTPPVVLAGLDLPGLDGAALCQGIRRAAHEEIHHVILLVPTEDRRGLHRALEAGADDVLVRPVDEDELGLRLLLAERRVAERGRMRDEHRAYVELLAEAPDLIQTVALDGRLLYANRSWFRILGYGEHEIGGLTFFDVLHPKRRAAARKAFRWVRRGRGVRRLQTELCTRDGRVLSVEGTLTPRFRGTVPTSVRVILHDVSRRERAETVLRNVLEGTSATTGADFFRSLVRHLSRALGVRHAVVAERLRGSVPRMRTLAVWSGDGYRRNRELALEDMRGPVFPGARFLGRLGARSYLGVPILGGGKPIGLLCVLDDGPLQSGPDALRILATFAQRAGAELERQRAEEAQRELDRRMQESQKLESLGVMAGGIAHDFNNLLTSIMGYASLAARAVAPDTPQARYLRDIGKASRRAADLAMQMLAYSGKGQFVREPLNLRELLEETLDLLRTDVTRRGIALSCDVPVVLPVVEGDPTQMRQVVMNLVLNAAQAMAGPGGELKVSVREDRVEEETLAACYVGGGLEPGACVTLEVEDTGPGMDATVLDRIFDPFFTTKPGGRGLGLAAVVGIVRGHGGALRVRSLPGEGTTMSVYLPRSGRPVPRTVPAEDASPVAGEGLILVVDDEPGVRQLTRDILETGGYRVVVAEDGRRGLEVFRQRGEEVDAVLLDMTMPVMGGVETFQALRGIRPDVRVIVSSGFTESEAIDRFGGQVPAAFLQKPYTAGDLLRAVAGVAGALPA